MTDTRTYLTRMILFLVVVGVGAALISRTLVPIFMVNPLLNGIIFAVIVIGITLNFRQVILLGPEARWIETFHAAPHGPTAEAENALAGLRTETSTERLKLLSPMARMLEGQRGRGRVTLSAQ